jgi:hypothetical protein
MRKNLKLRESDLRNIVKKLVSEAELYPAVPSPLPKHNDVGQYPAVGSGEPARTKRTGISAEEAEEAFNDSYEYNLKHGGTRLLDAIATHLLNIGVFR